MDPSLKEWNPQHHFLGTALASLKKAFYLTSFDDFNSVPNEAARKMYD
jgi:hypothetical protein